MAKIVVAEDDRHISRVITLWLERGGHKVLHAENGKRALELIRTQAPDLLVTDVNMPLMDGLDLLEAVRAENLLAHPAIVLTSRCDQIEIEARAARLGAVVHPKPFSPMHLTETVQAALQSMYEKGSDAEPGSEGQSRREGQPIAAG
jgi:DNA-binding response OmpR family regulator